MSVARCSLAAILALPLLLLATSGAGGPGSQAAALSERAGGDRVTKQEARAWQPNVRRALNYANRRQGRVSLTVVDMVGRVHRHDAHRKIRMASTVKVMLMVAYLRQDSTRGRELSADERALLRRMIRRSDNDAATQVRDMLGREPLDRLAARSGMKSFEWSSVWGYCRTSARDQARFMRTLKRYVPGRHWPFAQRQLARIVPSQRWGVADVKPAGWNLYFKGGWAMRSGGLNHQVSQLRRHHRRIGVAVLTTDNPSRAYGFQTLKGVHRRLLHGLPR